jgi:hypothetical protein
MTTDTDRLSMWDRALVAARWCRDKAAEFIVKFWLYVILWAVVGIAFTVLLYIDGKFSRGLAEGLEDIDPFSFQAMGWGFRLFAASFLLAAAVCIVKGIKGALTFRALGVFASVIVCLHAFGFGFQALQDRRDDALAVREVVALQANNSAEQITLLREQIETTRADRDRQVDRLQASINGIVGDGLNNDQLADEYRRDQTKAEDEAKAKISAAEAEIARLASEGNAAKQNIATVTADEKPWPALYVGMAQLATWSKEPDDWAIYLCGVGFIIFWVLLAESLVVFLPERIYLMHLADMQSSGVSESITEGVSNDVPPGYVRTEWTEDEYNEREQVWQDFKKRSTAQKLRTKLPIAHKEWIKSKTDEIKLAYKTGASPQEIYDASGFVTWNEYEAFVRKIFSAKAADRILGAVAKQDDPRAAKRMGDFMPQPEPEIEIDEPETVASEPEPEDTPQTEEAPQEPEKPLTNGALSIWQKPLPPITGDDEDEGAKRDELV